MTANKQSIGSCDEWRHMNSKLLMTICGACVRGPLVIGTYNRPHHFVKILKKKQYFFELFLQQICDMGKSKCRSFTCAGSMHFGLHRVIGSKKNITWIVNIDTVPPFPVFQVIYCLQVSDLSFK